MIKRELTVNPWVRIWLHSRETIRAIVVYNTGYFLPLLYWIYGFPLALQGAQNSSLGDKMPLLGILVIAALLAIVVGWVGINVGSALFYWTGKLLKGAGAFHSVRAAVAWASVPAAVTGVIWLILAGLFKNLLFSQQLAHVQLTGGEAGVFFVATTLQAVLAVWGFIILLKGLAEVQQFSVWKALLNVLLPAIIVFVVVNLLSWLFVGIS